MALEEIATFVEAVDRGSLTAAGKALGVPKSTVGRRIARLEDELGQELVRRSAHTFRLTEAGEALYRRAAPAVRDLAEAARLARDEGSAPVGELRVTVAVDIGSSTPFVRTCASFSAAYPGVRLVVDLSDRRVDLVAEGFDLAVRVHTGPLDDRATVKVRRLGAFTLGLYASPAYLDRAGRPRHPDELAGHACVRMEGLGENAGWAFAGPGETVATKYPLGEGLRTNSMGFVPPAIVVGAGIGLVPDLIGAELVATGLAEPVLPAWKAPGATLSLLWPASRVESRRLRAFLEHATASLVLPA